MSGPELVHGGDDNVRGEGGGNKLLLLLLLDFG